MNENLMEIILNELEHKSIPEVIEVFQNHWGLNEPLFYDTPTFIRFMAYTLLQETIPLLSSYESPCFSKEEEKDRAFEGLLCVFDVLKPHKPFLKQHFVKFMAPFVLSHALTEYGVFMKKLLELLKLPQSFFYQAWIGGAFLITFKTFLQDESLDDEQTLVKLDSTLVQGQKALIYVKSLC